MGVGILLMVYGVVVLLVIFSRGFLDFENVVGIEDELELDDDLDDELDDEELDVDELDDICCFLVEVMVSIGFLGGLGGGIFCVVFGRGFVVGGIMMVVFFSCCMIFGGELIVFVVCVGVLVLLVFLVFLGLFVREVFFFFLYKVEGGFMYIVFFLFYFLYKWFDMLYLGFLEF